MSFQEKRREYVSYNAIEGPRKPPSCNCRECANLWIIIFWSPCPLNKSLCFDAFYHIRILKETKLRAIWKAWIASCLIVSSLIGQDNVEE